MVGPGPHHPVGVGARAHRPPPQGRRAPVPDGSSTPGEPSAPRRPSGPRARAQGPGPATGHTQPAAGPTLSLRICLYTNSPDGHFILDHHPANHRAIIAAGFSGHGFKFAPVIGQILADLATTNTTEHPIQFLNLKRFHP